MKKNYVYILIISLFLLIMILNVENREKTFQVDDIKYAVSIDGESASSFPEKAPYDVSVQCSGAEGYWDYEKWVAKVNNITDNVSCSISFASKEKINLNTYIKDTLTGTTVGDGQVVNENGYRYEGANPNNYIKFNGELWRIIGVFDSTSHRQTGAYLTKIIRNDSIGTYAWDGNNVNIWPNSSLYTLLNTYYYNAQDGTESGYCYKYSTTTTGNCDWTTGGINDYYRPMVKNVTWYLGGYSSTSATAEAFYGYERSTVDSNYYTNNKNYKTTSGYIGLMYASDYGYSVLSSSCARTIKLASYNTDACAGNSWLYKDGYAWTITHRTSSASSVCTVYSTGNLINYYNAYNGYASQPVLYLDSSVYILTGNGTESNPYVIDM